MDKFKRAFYFTVNWVKKNWEVWFLLILPLLLIAYMIINKYLEPVWIVHLPIDDKIPFIEYFVVPYTLWYVTMPLSLVFFLFKDRNAYWNLCFLMYTSLLVSKIIFIVVPNAIPETLAIPADKSNIFVEWTRYLRGSGTLGACFPSDHCIVALSIDMIVQRSEFFKKKYGWRIVSFLYMVSICMATVFLKQHSFADMWGSLAVTLTLNILNILWVNREKFSVVQKIRRWRVQTAEEKADAMQEPVFAEGEIGGEDIANENTLAVDAVLSATADAAPQTDGVAEQAAVRMESTDPNSGE